MLINNNSGVQDLFRYGVSLLERLADRLSPPQTRQPLDFNIPTGGFVQLRIANKFNGIVPSISAGNVGVVFSATQGTAPPVFDLVLYTGYPSQYLPYTDIYETDTITVWNTGTTQAIGRITFLRY